MSCVGDRWRFGPWPRAPLAQTLVSQSLLCWGASGSIVASGLEDGSRASPSLPLFTHAPIWSPACFKDSVSSRLF